MHRRLLAAALVPVLACIWDSDTLDDEVLGLPEAGTLVVSGRWFRHGKAYYEKRVREIPPRLAAEPAHLDLYDDLAVAHDRLGDFEAALSVMERKARALEAVPDTGHRYRLLANRGTFLSHAGRYDEAIADLEKALAMNPESHFGRERFQIDLVLYLRAAKRDPAVWADDCFLSFARVWPTEGWGPFLRMSSFRNALAFRKAGEGQDGGKSPVVRGVTWQEAFAAVSGMLRFGGPEAPELYRTLGDLFACRGTASKWSDLNLAWCAWRRAVDLGHPGRAAIEEAMAEVEEHWDGSNLCTRPTAATVRRVRDSESAWLAALHETEAAALAMGRDAGDPAVIKELTAEADRKAGSPPNATEFLFLLWVEAYGKWFAWPAGTVLVIFLVLRLKRRLFRLQTA